MITPYPDNPTPAPIQFRGQQWRLEAGCIGIDPEAFFPDPKETILAQQAIAICMRCPVRLACLFEDLSWPTLDRFGVRGGFTQQQRRKMARIEVES